MQTELISKITNQKKDQALVVFEFKPFNPVWHDVGKQEKYSYFEPLRGNFYQAGSQNNPIDGNVQLQKNLEIFGKKSADKI